MLLAVLIIVVSSFLTAFAFTFIGEILQMLLGVSRQWMYNLPAICALLVTGVLYSTIILRMRRCEVQDALKSGESIRTVVNRRFLSQTLIFLGVFAIGAFLLAWIDIAEHFTSTVTPMGKGYVPSGVEFFAGWNAFFLPAARSCRSSRGAGSRGFAASCPTHCSSGAARGGSSAAPTASCSGRSRPAHSNIRNNHFRRTLS